MPSQWPSGRPRLIVVTVETTELSLPSRIETVEKAANVVADFVGRSGISEDAAYGIDMAVREAVTNAVVHGNQEDETKVVDLTLKSLPEAVEITIQDRGQGFNPEEVPDPTDAENILKTSGRGIFFMRTFMDEVTWSIRPDGGTTVRMLKRR
jgi:serine/threonine-protein kinase RsbW